MKKKPLNYLSLLAIAATLLFVKCDKGRIWDNPEDENKTIPTVQMPNISNITPTTARYSANVFKSGGSDVINRGVHYGSSQTNLNRTEINGIGIGSFTGELTNLQPNTDYYIRAYATNDNGTGYSEVVRNFTTEAEAGTQTPTIVTPTVTTVAVTNITQNSAISGGTITDDGGAIVTARGVCWNTSPTPTLDNCIGRTTNSSGTGSFTSDITGLIPGTTYYVRAYATNSEGTGYGDDENFETISNAQLPTVTTTAITNITETTATTGGTITDNGVSAITARGVCWNTSPTPTLENCIGKTTNGSGTDSFTSNITGLNPDTPYYVRAYATNSVGTNYGDEEPPFTTTEDTGNTFTDTRDNKTYKTVQIGSQTWMAENLAHEIPNKEITNSTTWENNSAYDGWCYYDNDKTTYGSTYGVLYQWEAAKIACPTGWRLPSDAEWKQLEMSLGMSQSEADNTRWRGTEGGKIKETGTTHWDSPNTGATNESGFTAVPGGYRGSTGVFDGIGGSGAWWSSTESSTTNAYIRYLSYNYSSVYRYYYYKEIGRSVRCLRD